ncbi:MAG: hypothetical protein A2Z81_09705 [Omnitrophica WOR_2 bacterium GWA2_45_18]|nr:MAG: hypothetical protein A2Z81_09705 [Omnitrophica WOR_2 bacterium GWA2_45_18]
MNLKIKVANRLIGEEEPAFIIAEAGSNHNGKLSQAKELIDAASRGGVDAVKFQLFKAEFLYAPQHPAFSIVKENEFPRDWLAELTTYANKKGILFLASVFDREAVDLLMKTDTPAFKIASSDTVNLPLLRYAASKKKPIFLSTAMCNLADIYEAIEVIRNEGNEQIVLMQCSALYPTEPSQVHLRAMDALKGAFRRPVGFSDHSLGILLPPVAVARGACAIEKHFTLSRKMKGPDHSYAIEPDELKLMAQNIRTVEQSLGSLEKVMLPEEKKLARRESLFARQDIGQNKEITAEMIEVKRPATGVEARFFLAFVGRKAKRAIKKGDPLLWQDAEA